MIKLVDLLNEIQHEQQQMAEIEKILGRPLTESEINELDLKRAAKNLALGAALGAATMFGSPKASAQAQPHPTTAVSTSNKTLENKIKKVLFSESNVSIWVSKINNTNVVYTFDSKNNSVDIRYDKQEGAFLDSQGYKGTWKLNGNKLIITNIDLKTTETFPVKIIDKETIMIGDNKFYYEPDYT